MENIINNIEFPRVLIIGETFRTNGGGGITMMNLFKDWPSEKLAVITDRIDETTPDANCTKYYQLGSLEYKLPYFLSSFQKHKKSGEVYIKKRTKSVAVKEETYKNKLKAIIKNSFHKILSLSGVDHFLLRFVVSDNLINWISNFKPDIIYCQPFRFIDMIFIHKIYTLTKIPLAIHIMDDSVRFINKPNILYYYWERRLNFAFSRLVNEAKIHLSISDFMSEEYYKRYKKRFIPFRNPIEFNSWKPYIKKDWHFANDHIRFIYTGRLVSPNVKSLLTVCNIIDRLNNKGHKVILDIYSMDNNLKFNKSINKLRGVYIRNPVNHSEIPKLIHNYDFTLLSIDFDKRGIQYAKYSISTKTSEYMISGVPIILFAPKEVALASYAIANKCMISANSNDVVELEEVIVNAINNINKRELYGKNAIAVAKSDSDAQVVRAKFRQLLSGIYSN